MIKLILANKPKYVPLVTAALAETGVSQAALALPGVVWFLLVDDTGVVGIAYAHQLTVERMSINMYLTPGNDQHPGRKQVGKDLLEYVKSQSQSDKFETVVPTTDTARLRWYAQTGFKREGISRASIRIDDQLTDQVHMGTVR